MRAETASRAKLVTASICVLILSQAFMAALSTASFEKIYLSFISSGYLTAGRDLKRSIEQGIRFGKPIEKLFGIEKLMEDVKSRNKELDNIVIFDPNGLTLHSLKPSPTALDHVPLPLRVDFNREKKGKSEDYAVIALGGRYHTLIPIKNKDGKWIGTLDLSFSESIVRAGISEVMLRDAAFLLAVTAGATLALIVLMNLFVSIGPTGSLPGRRVLILVSVTVAFAQIAYAGLNVMEFGKNYVDTTRSKVEALAVRLKTDIDGLLAKGVQINRLVRIEDVFNEIMENTVEIHQIAVTAPDGATLYEASAEGPRQTTDDWKTDAPDGADAYRISLPLNRSAQGESPTAEGYLRVDLSRAVMNAVVYRTLFDALTVVLISFLFLFESIVFLLIHMRTAGSAGDCDKGEAGSNYVLARPVAFIYLFSTALSLSFIPLHMKNLYEPLLGLSKEIILALPISLEMLCAMVTALAAGVVIDRKGWHVPFGIGICLSALGAFLSGRAQNGVEFIACRGVVGLGYGFAWMAIQGYVFTYTDPQYRARSIANLVAGIFSGQICGTAVGAMLAERIGYSPVFLIASVLSLAPACFVFIYMRSFLKKPDCAPLREKLKMRDLLRYVTDRNVVSILALVMVPFSICQIGLLNYAVPIYLFDMGISQSNIGRVLMIYGLSVVYIAPFISRYVDRSAGKKPFIAFGGVIGGLGLTILYFHSGFSAIIAGVFAMGLAGSLGGAAQSAFVLDLDITKEIGAGKAMSVQRAADKLGQMLGPLFIGGMIAAIGLENGIAFSGALYVGASVLFFIAAAERR